MTNVDEIVIKKVRDCTLYLKVQTESYTHSWVETQTQNVECSRCAGLRPSKRTGCLDVPGILRFIFPISAGKHTHIKWLCPATSLVNGTYLRHCPCSVNLCMRTPDAPAPGPSHIWAKHVRHVVGATHHLCILGPHCLHPRWGVCEVELNVKHPVWRASSSHSISQPSRRWLLASCSTARTVCTHESLEHVCHALFQVVNRLVHWVVGVACPAACAHHHVEVKGIVFLMGRAIVIMLALGRIVSDNGNQFLTA